MAATDQHDEARAWLRAEIDAQCFGDDFGFDCVLQLAGTPEGMALQYVIVITMRSPLLGQPPLMHVAGRPVPRLTAEMITHVVTNGLRSLRQLSAQALAPADGPPR
jgi:hypothetical protein